MGAFGIGQPVRRKEDDRFITGIGRYQDDIALDGALWAVFVRSPHAHAEIKRVDTRAAQRSPGVVAVLTASELKAEKVNGLPCIAGNWIQLERAPGVPAFYPHNPLLAEERVRHVGEAVVMVIAETASQARDAADLVEIDYLELPAIAETATAASKGTAQLFPEAPNNTSFVWRHGDQAKTDAAFKAAARVVSVSLVNNRIGAMPIEARGAAGRFDPASGRYTLITNAQHVYDTRAVVCQALGIDKSRVRVIAHDLGGGFGMKYVSYGEQALVLAAAKRLGRAVCWMSDRAESFLSDIQSRDHASKAELALDRDGRFLGLRVRTFANLGAYASNLGPVCPSILYTRMLACAYKVPAVDAEVVGVFTNTVFTDAYRGAGQPEAIYLVERLIDKAARETGIGRDEIRKRNFIATSEMPYKTPVDVTYESGDFVLALSECQRLAGWSGFEARRAEAAKRGKKRGLGLGMYVEATAGDPMEAAELRFTTDGKLTAWLGTKSSGQGHETTYAQFLNEMLGVPFDKIEILEGDSDEVPLGGGTGGSRSIYMAGLAIKDGVEKVVEKGKALAAHLLEVSQADIRFEAGEFKIVGTDRRIDVLSLAAKARDPKALPAGMTPGLDAKGRTDFTGTTFPNGCHIAEVEIDPDTGKVALAGYWAVNDFGRVVNPLLLEAQVHGGVAQGVGQALMEEVAYDPETGQLLTGSFMDYCMPRADDLPLFAVKATDIPCPSNPLGVKGCGEAGAIAACATVINAIVDALAADGVEHVDMPATPEKVWRAIHGSVAR
ncbi:MAG: xanthine dehydrogenase family protein molybdopterin-binding subunit [Alphaproteobacteria bacterium]|nr:xanthine dehydrogenase family protein molybdopterin-binding subunit [Alphaproteobacteria bacterium]